MAVQKRLFLLDAYALIFRGYYALIKNPRVNSKGQDTSAIMGFVNSLFDVIKREKPDHLAAAWRRRSVPLGCIHSPLVDGPRAAAARAVPPACHS